MNKDEVKQNIYNSLKELGLNEVEINLYSMSLAMGPNSISEVAKNLNISRPNVYKIISELEKHGLTKFTQLNRYSRKFSVESPMKILEKLREKREKMTQLDNGLVSSIPDLLTLYHKNESITKIQILQGKEQFIKLFNEILEQEKNEIEYFGSAEDFVTFISVMEEEKWIKKRIKNNTKIKSLLLPSKTASVFISTDKNEMRETKILNDCQYFCTSYQLFSNKAIIWQPRTPLAILIEDKFIVEMFRAIFYKLWNNN